MSIASKQYMHVEMTIMTHNTIMKLPYSGKLLREKTFANFAVL